MTSFAGWQMPLRYGSETAEHQAVRHAAGLFDLSHMGEILVRGPGAGAALDYALTGFISVLRPGRARYTMICAADGGVLDDLVVYRQGEQEYLVIANASNTSVVFDELRSRASGFDAVGHRRDRRLRADRGPGAGGGRDPGRPDAHLDLGAMKYYAGAFGSVAGASGVGGPDRVHRGGRLRGVLPSRGRGGRVGSGSCFAGPRTGWSRRAWPPAIRSGSRPACRCTATSSART